MDRRIERFFSALPADFECGSVRYGNNASFYGNNSSFTSEDPLAVILPHFFNHQTHHRGQAHALITGLGERTEDTDLFLVVPARSPMKSSMLPVVRAAFTSIRPSGSLSTVMRLVAVQRLRVVLTAPHSAPSTASSRLASSSTMMTFLPPISRQACLKVCEQASETRRPISVEPVKETTRTLSCFIMGSPTSPPVPVT